MRVAAPTLALLAGIALPAAAKPHSDGTERLPNVLWVITDDHRADSIRAYNKATRGKNWSPLGFVMSPAADKLASEGVLFTRAYCNSPGCAPSRTSMHYGRYPHRSGHYGFEQSHRQTPFAKKVLPELMRERGYQTALFGKSGYYIFDYDGKRFQRPEFYDTEVRMKDITENSAGDWAKTTTFKNKKKFESIVTWGFPDRKVRIPSPFGGEPYPASTAKQKVVDEELDLLYAYARDNPSLIIGGVSPRPTRQTTDGLIADSLRDYLKNANQQYQTPWGDKETGPNPDQPLYVHLSFHFPHTPILPSKEFRDRFIAKEKASGYRIPAFTQDELKKLPPQLVRWFEKTNFADMKDEDKRQSIRDYYAFCAMGDKLVGEAVDSFKQYSEQNDRDWLILYVIGDHGWHLGEQGGTSKFAPYDTSNHCAVIAVSSNKERWPAGEVCRDWVEFVDFAPTILKAAGADLSKPDYSHLDGLPMDEIRSGQTTRQYVIGEMNHVMGPRCYLRCEDFAFSMRNRKTNGKPGDKWGQKPGEDIKWALEAPRDDVEMALFDLRSDRAEQNNVANDQRYTRLADWFRHKLGRIILGDGRVECNWKAGSDDYVISDFAQGAHNRKLELPKDLIPEL